MEVSQAIWLIQFFIDALLISPKRFDEIILDFYQDAGIWIVIASCVAEYLLLLTYIGVAAYDFFKNRKMMKKMNVQRRTYEFLKFDESHRDVGNRLPNITHWSRKGAAKNKGAVHLKSSRGPGNPPRRLMIRNLPLAGLPIRSLEVAQNGIPYSSPLNLEVKKERKYLTKGLSVRKMNKPLKRKQIE